ncbi:major capsid protein [Bartonella sp. HY761]|uniref:major capsid protein n=1 Tax=Bartonella sp. HY761 TaxID=2979330 RepID=UPI0022053473|nr:major capsid protein [Bartonella sp. HY761]UXN07519.1 major capsid protein [Bartonella sp. HY761]
MAQMNTRRAQVIDPILTTQARGYTNAELISHHLLPVADIPNRSMKVIKFGKEAFRRYVDTRRAPGAETKRITFGYAADTVALAQESLEALVPIETQQDAQSVPGIDLAAVSIELVQDIIGLGREVDIANMVRDDSLYDNNHKLTLTGNDKWSAQSSNPSDDIDEAKDNVRRSIGRYPNTLVIGPSVFKALKRHERIKDQFKYTNSDSLTTEMLAAYFDIDKVVVGKAVGLPETAGDDEMAQDVWGNDAILAYVPNGSNFMVPAFGYTYRLTGYPIVEAPYFENSRKSWIYPVTEEFKAYVTGQEAGFLFKAAA